MSSKLFGAGIVAAAILASPLAAQAADLRAPSYKAPAYVSPAYASWSGFYVGIVGTYGFGKSSWSNAVATTGDFDVKGPMAGGTVGYNFQTGSWVWGLEGDLSASWMKGTAGTAVCVPDCETKNTWFGTGRARLGYAGWNNWMPYLTGGAAFGDIKATQGGASITKTKVGWTAGVGVEYAFLGNWSTKIEYLYADLGKATCSTPTCGLDTEIKLKANLVRVGLNYRF
ncbi:MAG TPA: outer membrane protein [Pseudolabrys sp.]|nr:outer membrane protein [Pseudolabrys sp.]